MQRLKKAFGLFVSTCLALSGTVKAQTIWTGSDSPSWVDPLNWTAGVPTSGTTALFNGQSPNTSVDLTGSAHAVGTISFDSANVAAYTFSGNGGDAFVFDAAGGVTASSTVTTNQTFNSLIENLGSLNINNAGSGLLAFNGSFTQASGGAADLLTVGGAGNTVIAGSLGTNFTALTKNDAGTLALSNNGNTYAGATTVNGGTLSFSSPGSLGDSTSLSNSIALNNGATLQYTGAAADLGVNRSITIGAIGATIETGANTLTVSGSLSGAGTLAKGLASGGGAGALILTGANTGFTGNINLNSGTIQVGAADALGSAGNVTVQGTATGIVLNGVVTNPGKTLISDRPTAFLTSSATSTFSGPIVLGVNGGMTISLTANTGEVFTLGGNITSSVNYTSQLLIRGANPATGTSSIVSAGTITLPNATVSKTDPSTWVINSTGNSWATTTLAGGVIQLGATNGLPTNVNITIGQGTTTTTLDLHGFDQTVGNLASAGTQNEKILNSGTTASHLTVNSSLATSFVGAIQGNVQLVKQGLANLTLAQTLAANADTYTGGTSILAGGLYVNNTTGSGTGTGAVTATGSGLLDSGGTLGGTGSISGAVTISSTTAANQGGVLSPGATGVGSVGKLTLTSGNATFNPQGDYVFDYNAAATGTASTTTSDFLSGTGAGTKLSLANLGTGAGQQFNLTLNPVTGPSSIPTTPVTYTLATFAGGITLPTGMTGTDLTPYFSITGQYETTPTVAVNGTSVQVTFTPVPEPTSALLLLAAGLPMFRRRRTGR